MEDTTARFGVSGEMAERGEQFPSPAMAIDARLRARTRRKFGWINEDIQSAVLCIQHDAIAIPDPGKQ